MSSKVVRLTAVSDLSCPWCYIGQKAVMGAINDIASTNSNISFEIEYRPYQLHPSISDDKTCDRDEWLIKNFGVEKAHQLISRVRARAKESGLNIRPKLTMCSTLNAHRLLYKAWNVGRQKTQQAVLDVLFEAYFGNGALISDKRLLADCADKAGVMTRDEALEYLDSDEDLQEVRDMINQARAGGISGVPVLIIDGRWAISGGQAKEVFLQIFKKLALGGGSPPHINNDLEATCPDGPKTCEGLSCQADDI